MSRLLRTLIALGLLAAAGCIGSTPKKTLLPVDSPLKTYNPPPEAGEPPAEPDAAPASAPEHP